MTIRCFSVAAFLLGLLAAPVLAQDPPPKPEDALDAGRKALDAGKLREAIAALDKAVAQAPADWRGWYYRARARRQSGDAPGAVADLTRVIALDAGNVHAYCWRGEAQLVRGDIEAASKDFARAIELDPRHARSYSFRARALFVRGKKKQALAALDKALELDPRRAVYLADRGGVRLALGMVQPALADLTKALSLQPRGAVLAQTFSTRARAFVALGRHAAALEDINAAIKAVPPSVALHRQRAAVHLALGNAAAALLDAERALALDPKSPRDLLDKAKAAKTSGPRVAWIALRRAIAAGLPAGWTFTAMKPVARDRIAVQARTLPGIAPDVVNGALAAVREVRVISFVGPDRATCHLLVAVAKDGAGAARFVSFDVALLKAKAKAFGARKGYEVSALAPAAAVDLSAAGGSDGWKSAIQLAVPARKLVFTSVAVVARRDALALELSVVAPGKQPTIDAMGLIKGALGALKGAK